MNKTLPLEKYDANTKKMCYTAFTSVGGVFLLCAFLRKVAFAFGKERKQKTASVEGGKTLNLPGGVQNESENNTRLQ